MTAIVITDNIVEASNGGDAKKWPVSWVKAALKEFESFPGDAQSVFLTALTIAADGGKADTAKPMHGLGSGVFEIAHRFHGDALR